MTRMRNCSNCEELPERFNIGSLREYRAVILQLIEFTNRGTLVLEYADFPLREMLKTPIPGDSAEHYFRCSACRRTFRLSADTFHGGASWTPDPRPPPSRMRESG